MDQHVMSFVFLVFSAFFTSNVLITADKGLICWYVSHSIMPKKKKKNHTHGRPNLEEAFHLF